MKNSDLLTVGAVAVGLLMMFNKKTSVSGKAAVNGYVRKVNRKYSHFAVRKSDNMILTGWETMSDVDSLRYFAKLDLVDMDVNPKEYKILSKSHLKKIGIDPMDWSNWIVN
jgi:hypothetical protein